MRHKERFAAVNRPRPPLSAYMRVYGSNALAVVLTLIAACCAGWFLAMWGQP